MRCLWGGEQRGLDSWFRGELGCVPCFHAPVVLRLSDGRDLQDHHRPPARNGRLLSGVSPRGWITTEITVLRCRVREGSRAEQDSPQHQRFYSVARCATVPRKRRSLIPRGCPTILHRIGVHATVTSPRNDIQRTSGEDPGRRDRTPAAASPKRSRRSSHGDRDAGENAAPWSSCRTNGAPSPGWPGSSDDPTVTVVAGARRSRDPPARRPLLPGPTGPAASRRAPGTRRPPGPRGACRRAARGPPGYRPPCS